MRLKFNFYKRLVLTAMILIFTGLAVTGADCEKLLLGTPGDVTGTWELVRMQGNAQDVCIGEIIQFQSTGNAILTCPNGSSRNRQYTLENGVLTFTETNVTYNVTTQTTNGIEQMVLDGISISRVLTYNQVTTAARNSTTSSSGNVNSSESENK